MVELAPDFDEFFGSLIAHGVEFLVFGPRQSGAFEM
jgi:hypothetical protein